jgi:hypothetical protein
MNIRSMRIDEMQTGIRRQEVWGDINALGTSMTHDDLRHSIVVDEQLTLIA